MGALASSGYPAPLAAAVALQAGADLLLFNRDHELHRQAHAQIVAWVREGKIPESRLDEAARRVLETKLRFGMLAPKPVDAQAAAGACGTADHRQLSRGLAGQAVRCRRGQVNLPVRAGLVLAGGNLPEAAGLAQRLGFPIIEVTGGAGAGGDISAVEAAVRSAPEGSVVIATLYDASFRHPEQLEMVKMLAARGIPLVVAALGSPFDVDAVPEGITALAAFGSNPPALDALAEMLRKS
jgi:beta-N-acetylhexosaminidase